MATPDYLSRIPLFVENQALEEYNSLEVNLEANPQKIVTILKGLAGKSDGPAECNVSCTSAIPLGGPEFDFWNTCLEGSWATVQIGVGDGDYVGNGWFTRVRVTASSDKAAEVSFEWTGKAARLE